MPDESLLSFTCKSKGYQFLLHFSLKPLFKEFLLLQGTYFLLIQTHKYSCINHQIEQLTQVIIFMSIWATQLYTCNHTLHTEDEGTYPQVLDLAVCLTCNHYYHHLIMLNLTPILALQLKIQLQQTYS